MLENLRKRLFIGALKKALETHKRLRKPSNLDHAIQIGVLFDATHENQRRAVQDYALGLEKKGKKVTLFGFFNTKTPPEKPPFGNFSSKDLAFSRQPKSEIGKTFTTEKFDLLICFNPDQIRSIEWIAALSLALMKVGLPTTLPNDYDVVLEPTPSDNQQIQGFATQLQTYLDKIVLPNASTR